MISKDFFCRHPRKHQVFLKVCVYISLKYREILSRLITNPFQTLPTLMFGVIKHVLILYSCVSWGFQCSAVSRQMLPMSVSHPHTDYNHVSWSEWKGQHEVQLSVCLSVCLTDRPSAESHRRLQQSHERRSLIHNTKYQTERDAWEFF